MKKKVIAAGHICLDITPIFPETKTEHLEDVLSLSLGKLIEMKEADVHTGGSVANTGLAMKILGADGGDLTDVLDIEQDVKPLAEKCIAMGCKAVQLGVAKVNIFTDIDKAGEAGVENGIAAGERTMMGLIPYEIDAMKKVVAEKICLFGSDGKARI